MQCVVKESMDPATETGRLNANEYWGYGTKTTQKL